MTEAAPRYWYPLSYTEAEADIARAEAACLLSDLEFVGPLAISSTRREPRRSAHLRARLAPLARAESADELVAAVSRIGLGAELFKIEVHHLHCPKNAAYHRLADELGAVIDGGVDLRHPQTLFWALETTRGWWFGQVEALSTRGWRAVTPHEHTFSSALPPRLALACVSMACGDGHTFLDPCCGCGTMVLQAAALGLTAVGADLNPRMVWLTRRNLREMNLRALVCRADARSIAGRFDGVAANLPYGRYLPTQTGLYEAIAANLVSWARRAVFVAGADYAHTWAEAGFQVVLTARVKSQSLTRWVHVCTATASEAPTDAG